MQPLFFHIDALYGHSLDLTQSAVVHVWLEAKKSTSIYPPTNGTRTSLEKAYLLFTCKAVVLSPLLALQFKLSSLFFIMPSMLQLCFLSPPLGSVPPNMYVGSPQQSAAGVREACFEDSVL